MRDINEILKEEFRREPRDAENDVAYVLIIKN